MISQGPFTRGAARVLQRGGVVVLLGCICLMAAWSLPNRALALGSLAMGATLLSAFAVAGIGVWLHERRKNRALDLVKGFVANDVLPTFVTDGDGAIRSRNAAAEKLAGGANTMAGALERSFANPGAVLFRLQTKAACDGHAGEDVVSRRGHTRISAHRLEPNAFLWRLEDMADRVAGGRGSVALPLLTVGRSGTVLSMNDAARRLIGDRHKSLDRIFPDLPPRPGHVQKVSTAEGGVDCLIAQSEGVAGRREIFLLPPPADMRKTPATNEFFDTLPVALVQVDARGHVRRANRMALELLGRMDCEGQPLSSLMEGLGRSISDWIADALADRLPRHSEFLRLARSDREVFVQVALHATGDTGQAELMAVLSDATEFKTLEAQFVQSQKMQAIGQLAGGVAHDFNNLLTAISGHCDLLLLRHDQGDPDFSDLVQINQNANRAAALVGQLLAFSRKQTLRPETLDMRDTLADLTHLLNRLVGEKVTLTLSHDPVLAPIRADKRQLEQVLMNLVVNARDAMPAGGEIRIVTEVTSLDQPLERDRVSVPAGRYVTVQVHDDGTGIPKDKLQKVFEPFFTTKRTGEGTGLGLSTAYGIVKQTGGFIFLDSELGRGTCFTLYFPVLEGQPTAVAKKPPASPAQSPLQRSDGVILLVEDEAPVRAFASRALRLRGYTVLEAESAEAALMMLEDKELDIDVFVTDVVMPGMDGPSWVRQALKQRPDVRVVFVSGYAEDNFGQEQSKIPNSVFLPKPFSLTDLTTTVHNQLH